MATPRLESASDAALRRPVFRPLVGFICLVGGLAGLLGLYLVEVPEGNREPLLLALGLVLGWGSAVVQSEYGSSATGRRVVESTIRRLEEPLDPSESGGNGPSSAAKGNRAYDPPSAL